jgi:hypothetical protein
MTKAGPIALQQELVTLGWGNRLSQALLELLVPFALCVAVVGAIWYFLRA